MHFNFKTSVTKYSIQCYRFCHRPWYRSYSGKQVKYMYLKITYLYKSCKLPVPSSVDFQIDILFLKVAVFFHVEREIEEPSFDMTVTMVNDTLDIIKIKTCAQ